VKKNKSKVGEKRKEKRKINYSTGTLNKVLMPILRKLGKILTLVEG